MSCLRQKCSLKDDNLQHPAKFLSWVAVLIADIYLMYAKHHPFVSVYRPLVLQTFQICFEILGTSFRIKPHTLRSCTALLEHYNLIINLILRKVESGCLWPSFLVLWNVLRTDWLSFSSWRSWVCIKHTVMFLVESDGTSIMMKNVI